MYVDITYNVLCTLYANFCLQSIMNYEYASEELTAFKNLSRGVFWGQHYLYEAELQESFHEEHAVTTKQDHKN
jgi:hypothetical protein